MSACCTQRTFDDGFYPAYRAIFGTEPAPEVIIKAMSDFRAGNTGWEAAQNAKHYAKEASDRANAKPLVCIGGRNYAEAGSALALKFGQPQPAVGA